MKRDLVVFGSARTDVFLELPPDKVDEFCKLDTKKCVIELTYGSKIPLNNVTFEVGGNGANVSVGTTRLGVDAVLAAEIGNGPLADYTKKHLDKQVDTTYVTQTHGVGEGFGAVIMYGGERTILSYYPDYEPKFPSEMCGVEWAYLTSIGEKFENYYEKVYEWIKGCGAKLAFNPGGRQLAKGPEWVTKYVSITYMLIANRQEAEEIAAMHNESFGKEKELLAKLGEMGPKLVVVTDGSNGSFIFDKERNRFLKANVVPVDSFERTGAGDAFSSGSLAAIIQGKPLEEALLWGTLNSTSVIGHIGPEPGLLDTQKMNEWLERGKDAGLSVNEF